jgi:TolB protein
MTRRTRLHLPALIVAGVLMACAVVVLALSENAEATFPGKNGGIAYSAFDFDRGPDDTIYTINPGGGAKTQLTRGYQPSYSPNGKKIAYTLFGGADSEIYTINVGGDAMTQLTHNNNDENFPSYSPNGKRIAYTRTTYRRVTPTVSADPIDEIFTVKVGGGAKTKVTIGSDPSFSPDGKRIVYYAYDKTASKRLPDTEIYTINVGGGHKTQLTHNNKDEFTPDYSPHGKRIVYAGLEGLERNDAESDIYTIKAGGGGKTQVTNNDNVDDLHPSYSPDGKKIAYTRIISRDAGPPISDIYTINTSGGGGKFPVTHTNALFESGPSWGSRP